jgi:hypothetical protein
MKIHDTEGALMIGGENKDLSRFNGTTNTISNKKKEHP